MVSSGGIFLIFSITLTISFASRNFHLILKDIECIVNQDYVVNKSCAVVRYPPTNRINVDGQMLKEVKDLRLDIFVDLERPKKETLSFFRITNLEACKIFNTNLTIPVLKMFKDTLDKSGVWPTHCPVPVDFRYRFQNLTVDTDFLPVYVPETGFTINISLKDKKTNFWHITILGEVERKKKKKIPMNVNL